MLGRPIIGIDLGTVSVLVHIPRRGIVLREPSVVARDRNTRRIVAVGMPAEEMLGRTPEWVEAIRPLRDGVIADYEMTAAMLRHFMRQVCPVHILRPCVSVSVPARVTGLERKAVVDSCVAAGAGRVSLIEVPLAAALGAGLDVSAARGCMVVDVGGGTTDVAVLSLGGVAVADSIKVAGNRMDEAIARAVRKAHRLLIGERTAEEVKIRIGAALADDELAPTLMEVRGRDLLDGMPRSVTLTAEEVWQALEEPVAAILEAVKSVLEKAPPELSADLVDRGIVLTGGSALLRGLDRRLAAATGMPVRVADDPLVCVALGTGTLEALQLAS